MDVVVVAYGHDESLSRALHSVVSEAEVATVTVVDNRGDVDPSFIQPLRVDVVRAPGNVGFGAGQNLGLACGRADYVLMLNPDAAMRPGAIPKGLAALRREPSIGAVQGICRDVHGVPDRSHGRAVGPFHLLARSLRAKEALAWPLLSRVAEMAPWSRDYIERVPQEPLRVESFAATALLCRRRAVESVGGFDENFFLYGEDLDLSFRLRAAGHALVALPVEWASHVRGGTFADSWSREIEWWRGTLLYAAKWWPAKAWALGLIAATLRPATWPALSPRRLGEFVSVIRHAARARRAFQADGVAPPS